MAFALSAFVATAATAATTCGDFNEDGSITPTDAVGVLTVALGQNECALLACDVDSNGRIAVTDAVRVLQRSTGLDVTLSCPADDDGWHPSSSNPPAFRIVGEDAFHVHTERPRLYLRPADIPWLIARGQGSLSVVWQELEWMASTMAAESPSGSRATNNVTGWYGSKGRAVAFMALLKDDADYARWSIDWGLALARRPIPTGDTPLRAEIERLAVVYDWMHGRMTEVERTEMRDGLIDRITALRAYSYMQQPGYIGGHERWGFSVLAMALIALSGDYEQADTLLAECRGHLNQGFYPTQAWIAADGGYHMGWAYSSGYTNVDRPYLVWTTGTNDVLLGDWTGKLSDWYLYGLRGDDRFPQMGDAFSVDPNLGAVNAIYAAGIAKDGHARWYLDNKLPPKREPMLQLLLLDPTVTAVAPTSLRKGRLFENAGVVIARDRWDEATTHLTFKSAKFLSTNHHHRDQNTFSLHYKEPLAIDSGYYDQYGSPHFRNYFTRTIAHNGIVVVDPDQSMSWGGREISNDGGQVFRTEAKTLHDIAPGGSASLDGITRFEDRAAFTYARGDATRAYDGARVSLAQRDIVYLRGGARPHPTVVVFDRVSSTNAGFEKRFLLHTVEEPTVSGKVTVAEKGGARLTSVTLYPTDAEITVVGGAGREFEVDGTNYPLDAAGSQGSASDKGIEPGSWRVEVSPGASATEDHFLHALFVSDGTEAAITAEDHALVEADDAVGVALDGHLVVFPRAAAEAASIEYETPSAGAHTHIVTGLTPGRTYKYRVGGGKERNVAVGDGGCAVFSTDADAGAAIRVRRP